MSYFNEETIIGGYLTDHLYVNEFRNGEGKFFNVIIEDTGNTSLEYEPPFPSRNRIKLTISFINKNNDIKEVHLRKFKFYANDGWVEQHIGPGEPMAFTWFSFQKLAQLLQLLSELDLANVTERRLVIKEGVAINADTAGKVKAILERKDGQELLEELLRSGIIKSHDIVNIGYRKDQLAVFAKLLREPAYYAAYAGEQGLTTRQEEKIWQHFFQKNPWIFGYGLDYRFLEILQAEAHIADTDLAGQDGAILDFLMGCTNFTVLVEVKKPSTQLFSKSQNRANSWRLSTELIDAVSQILEQKASWQIKAEANVHKNYDDNENLIKQRTVDPKCILIVSSNTAFNGTGREREIKLRTFELFRRDTRNIEIITYDELYERACFIVSEKPADTAPEDEDIPF